MPPINSLENVSRHRMKIAEAYRGAGFRWERWRRPHADWDHDHCLFCQVCICDSGNPGHYAHAFVKVSPSRETVWVCRSCFKLASQALEWRRVSSGDED
jgi:hypothetical protein